MAQRGKLPFEIVPLSWPKSLDFCIIRCEKGKTKAWKRRKKVESYGSMFSLCSIVNARYSETNLLEFMFNTSSLRTLKEIYHKSCFPIDNYTFVMEPENCFFIAQSNLHQELSIWSSLIRIRKSANCFPIEKSRQRRKKTRKNPSSLF